MAQRRAVTEGMIFETEDGIPIDLNNLKDDEMKALAMAYAMAHGGDIPEDSEQEGEEDDEVDSDIDDIDPANFKGIYFNEDPNRKYQDPETGCHFEYFDLCKRLVHLKEKRKILDIELGLTPVETPPDSEPIQKPKQSAKQDSATSNNKRVPQVPEEKSVKKPSLSGQQMNFQQLSMKDQGGVIQRRQIKGVQEQNQQMLNNNNKLQVDWLQGKNLQGYINDLKSKIGAQNFRSKSHEKAQNLLIEQNSSRLQQKQIQQQNVLNNIQHRKQQSQQQKKESEIQQKENKNQSRDSLGKSPGHPVKKSRGELPTGIGQYSFDRRTFDDKSLNKKDEFSEVIMSGHSIYHDQQKSIPANNRQFRNSHYNSNINKTQIDSLYHKAQSLISKQQAPLVKQGNYINMGGHAKTRNSGGFGGAYNHPGSMNQKSIQDDLEKSPYFLKQKQQQAVFSSQQNKRKPQQMIDSIEVSGLNPYSRNAAQDQVKTSYSQKTHDLLQSVQKNTNLINNIKYGGIQLSGPKRIISNNAQFRKSFGGVAPLNQNGKVSGQMRPGTGKLKNQSQDTKMGKLNQNDRSRQKTGVMAALPSNQPQKSIGGNSSNGNGYPNNYYYINKSHHSFKA